MKTRILLFILSGWLLAASQLLAQTLPAGFTTTTLSTGWNGAVGLTFNTTGSQMFVWEQPGKVWVVAGGQRQLVLDISEEVGSWEDQGLIGFALDPHFDTNHYLYLLYVVDRHYLLNYGTPAYSPTTNDYYSATIGRLTRYTATPAGTAYTVDPASRLVLLGATKSTGIPSTFEGHVTAGLAFGTDGTLLIGTGDGAHTYQDTGSNSLSYYAQALADGIIQPKENVGSLRSQLVDCLSGKILRIDPATGAGVPSNPFYDPGNPTAPRSKVWALGLRNPFRMTLKPGTGSTDPTAGNPGTLYLGDVGASTWEEVDVVDRPRLNFGWPLFEGLTPFTVFQQTSVANLDAPNPLYGTGGCTQQYFNFQDLLTQATPTGTASFPNPCNTAQTIPASVPTFVHARPVLDYNHNAAGPSRTGIFSGGVAATANLGAAGSPVSGSQFGGHAVAGGVFYPYPDFPAPYQNAYFFGDFIGGWMRSLTANSANQPSAVADFVASGTVPVAFATSPGETGLFYVNFAPSEIRKLNYGPSTSGVPPVAVASVDKNYGPSPLAVQFTGSASTDPSGGTLTYLWNFGDGTTSTAASPAHTFTTPTAAPTAYQVTLTVTNGHNLSRQTKVLVSANNTPPQVTITSPVNNSLYPLTSNTLSQLRATVTDAEQGGHLLSYQWQTILHHQAQDLPGPVDTTRQTSTTLVPYGCSADTYYYRIVLTVTDAAGLATTQEVRLYPDCNATSFTLVNADNDTDIQSLFNGATLDLAKLPTRNLNIRANANPSTTASVVFKLTGAATQNLTENVLPYALFSDYQGAYFAWTPPVGSYTLLATPYAGTAGTGTAGQALTIGFSVTDSGSAGPFTLTTSTVGSGTVVASPSQATYPSGTSVTLTATPSTGFVFGGWSGAATGTTNPLAVTMNANQALTATFVAAQSVVSYTLVNADNATDIQPLAAGAVLNLATLPTRNLTIRANTNPATVGSVVFALSGAATRSQTENLVPYALFSDDDAGTYYAWTPPVGSYSLLATPYAAGGGTGAAGAPLTVAFSVIDQAAGPYTLTTTTVGSGTVAASPSQATYASGATVTLTATPAAGYAFTGWSGGATGTANPLTISITANKTITATFTAQYTLTVDAVGSGTVTKSPSQATYASGTSVMLTATPATGYVFGGWSGAATGTTNPLAVSMTASKTITATFSPPQVVSYTLINADTDLDLQPLASGATLNLATLPTRNLAIRANTNPATVGSVTFILTGAQTVTHTENIVPYSLFADTNGDYPAWTPPAGSYSLKATPYVGSNGAGLVGTPLTITFSVANAVAKVAALGAAPGSSDATAATATVAGAAGNSLQTSIPALAYPNPSADGRYRLLLPPAWQGLVHYQLLSTLGATVASGALTGAPGAPAPLDFSPVMLATGLYMLLLDNQLPGQPSYTAQLKLLRK